MIVDGRITAWGLSGGCRKTIQKAILGKFLNYEESARVQFRSGDLVLSVTRDSERLVAQGFMNIFEVAEKCGKFLILLLARVLLGFLAIDEGAGKGKSSKGGGGHVQEVVALLLVFPVVMIPFIQSRRHGQMRLLSESHVEQNKLAHHIEQTVQNYRIIADFDRRP